MKEAKDIRPPSGNGSPREGWVDAAKGLACLLVVAGHGWAGLVEAGVLADGTLWYGLKGAIYSFHVQLFFLCSGYLWQRYGHGTGPRAHVRAALGKAWVLGVPYLAFSTLSWLLKKAAAPWVNHPPGGPSWDVFTDLPALYWFLPVLAALFLLLPRVRTARTWGCMLLATAVLKGCGLAGLLWHCPLLFWRMAEHGFWFATGMGLALSGTAWFRRPGGGRAGATCALLFLGGSVLAAVFRWWPPPWRWKNWFLWGMGLLACVSVLAWAVRREGDGCPDAAWRWLGRRALPVFLMHTMFAAGVRMVLLALGIRSAWVHLPAALAIGVAGPLAALRLLEWIRLDGLVYPRRFRDRFQRQEKRIGPTG